MSWRSSPLLWLALLSILLATGRELWLELQIREAWRERQPWQVERLHQARIARWERAAGREHPVVGLLLWRLAISQYWIAPDHALQSVHRARAILGDRGPDGLVAAGLMHTTGAVLDRLGRWPEAEKELLAAVELRERQLGRHNRLTRGSRFALATVWVDLAPERALETYEELLPGVGLPSARVGMLWNNIGVAKMRLSDFEGALAAHEEALRIRRRLLPADHEDLGQSLRNRLTCLCAVGAPTETSRSELRDWYRRSDRPVPATFAREDPCANFRP